MLHLYNAQTVLQIELSYYFVHTRFHSKANIWLIGGSHSMLDMKPWELTKQCMLNSSVFCMTTCHIFGAVESRISNDHNKILQAF